MLFNELIKNQRQIVSHLSYYISPPVAAFKTQINFTATYTG